MQGFEKLNELVIEKNLSDFGYCFNGSHLTMQGSFDLCYYHDVEVLFSDVSYISLPTSFQWPHFRMANDMERMRVGGMVEVCDGMVVCVEAEISSSIEKLPFFIVAKQVELKVERVMYA